MKSLVAEKCKPCEIYSRMCDVYGEACLSKKCLQMGKTLFAVTNPGRKDSPWKRKTQKEKVWDAAVSKEDHFDSLLRPMEKGAIVNTAIYCQFLEKNSPYLLNESRKSLLN